MAAQQVRHLELVAEAGAAGLVGYDAVKRVHDKRGTVDVKARGTTRQNLWSAQRQWDR